MFLSIHIFLFIITSTYYDGVDGSQLLHFSFKSQNISPHKAVSITKQFVSYFGDIGWDEQMVEIIVLLAMREPKNYHLLVCHPFFALKSKMMPQHKNLTIPNKNKMV